jgi:carboxyl-terminal processing protease
LNSFDLRSGHLIARFGRSPCVSRRLRTYLTDALRVVEQSALLSPAVDWAEVHREADTVLKDAKQYAHTYDFLEEVLVQAGGRHSGLIRPGRRRQLSPEERAALGPPLPTGHVIESASGPIAYLRVPRTNRDDPGMAHYIAAGEDVLRTLTPAEPRGWIVDLRANVGGNMWPMLAVACPLLPEGVLGHFEDREGGYQEFGVRAGSAYLDNHQMAHLNASAALLRHDQAPIAVLVSHHTASAGEAVALAFQGRPGTRLIGTPTRGLTTSNISHTLRDKIVMRITKSYFADRQRIRCEGPIPPDQDLTGRDRSAVLDAAISWITRS